MYHETKNYKKSLNGFVIIIFKYQEDIPLDTSYLLTLHFYPLIYIWGGAGGGEGGSAHLFVHPSVCVPKFVWTISPELLNNFKQTWYLGVLS